ncbi:MAG: hypothetical protein AAGA70_16725 [Pseudomonadota bacterium]
MMKKKLEVQLFGGFFCRWSDGKEVELRGVKHRALLAILATAANGAHTRSWIQETLWMLSGEELGRASLRRALSDLRKIFGSDFDEIFTTTNADVRINLDRVDLIGRRTDGVFLDGLNIPEPGFREWLTEKRRHYENDFGTMLLSAREGVAPKLAVLPFMPRSRSEDEQHLADLLAMEVSRSLSRSRLIDVISHLSARRLNARILDMGEIRKTLGFDYVVYGSVQMSDDGFRIEADLADTTTGRIIWTEQFTGRMAELINGQTSLISDLSSRIGHGILKASVELSQGRPVADIHSHALLMSAVTLMHGRNRADFVRSKEYLEELIRRLPNQATLHAWLGKWHVMMASQGWDFESIALGRAADHTARALDTDAKCAFSLAVDGMVHSHFDADGAIVTDRFEQSLQLDPSNALAWLLYSRLHMFNGNGQQALDYAERACMLSPCDPHQYFYDLLLACAKSVCGDYEGALGYAERSLQANPSHNSTHRVRTITLSLMDRMDEAQLAAQELLTWEPELTVTSYLRHHPAGADRQMTKLWAEALKRAGVPDT